MSPSSLGRLLAHDQHGGGAVGDLRGVAGGDDALGVEGRLELGERLDGGVGADALVGADHAVDGHDLAGLLVAAAGRDRQDLAVEAALVAGARGPLLRGGRELVDLVARRGPTSRR